MGKAHRKKTLKQQSKSKGVQSAITSAIPASGATSRNVRSSSKVGKRAKFVQDTFTRRQFDRANSQGVSNLNRKFYFDSKKKSQLTRAMQRPVMEHQENIEFSRDQASLFEREMVKTSQHGAFTWSTGNVGENRTIQLQPPSFFVDDTEKPTSLLMNEAVEAMGGVSFEQRTNSRNKSRRKLYDRDKAQSLDEMVFEDDTIGIIDTRNHEKRTSPKKLSSSASSQFQRQRLFQLQQLEIGDEDDEPYASSAKRKTEANMNLFDSLTSNDFDDSKSELSDGSLKNDKAESPMTFNAPTFQVDSTPNSTRNSRRFSTGSVGLGNSCNSFGNVILEEEEDEDW